MANQTIQSAKKMIEANTNQSSQGLLVEKYCLSVLEQPKVDLEAFKNLKKFETQINDGLTLAQSHSNNYLNSLQPLIIRNIANIGAYYNLHNAVATTLPPGATDKEWVESLNALKDQSQQYQTHASDIARKIGLFRDAVTVDSAAFSKIVVGLNAAVEGDGGVLSDINTELSTIQGKIDGAIAGIVLSGLAIVGGVFVTAVGAVADFVTAGASTPLVVGGIAIIAAGVGGEVASALILKGLNEAKAGLLQDKADLKAEVKLALGISSGYASLGSQAKTAATAATQMQNAWTFLESDLGAMISDLEKGVVNAGQLRTIFLTAANSEIKTVMSDITTIKHQMSGVRSVPVPAGRNVGDAILEAAKQAA